jgi:hypothetical protein
MTKGAFFNELIHSTWRWRNRRPFSGTFKKPCISFSKIGLLTLDCHHIMHEIWGIQTWKDVDKWLSEASLMISQSGWHSTETGILTVKTSPKIGIQADGASLMRIPVHNLFMVSGKVRGLVAWMMMMISCIRWGSPGMWCIFVKVGH